jgi:hypothetical protein
MYVGVRVSWRHVCVCKVKETESVWCGVVCVYVCGVYVCVCVCLCVCVCVCVCVCACVCVSWCEVSVC